MEIINDVDGGPVDVVYYLYGVELFRLANSFRSHQNPLGTNKIAISLNSRYPNNTLARIISMNTNSNLELTSFGFGSNRINDEIVGFMVDVVKFSTILFRFSKNSVTFRF